MSWGGTDRRTIVTNSIDRSHVSDRVVPSIVPRINYRCRAIYGTDLSIHSYSRNTTVSDADRSKVRPLTIWHVLGKRKRSEGNKDQLDVVKRLRIVSDQILHPMRIYRVCSTESTAVQRNFSHTAEAQSNRYDSRRQKTMNAALSSSSMQVAKQNGIDRSHFWTEIDLRLM